MSFDPNNRLNGYHSRVSSPNALTSRIPDWLSAISDRIERGSPREYFVGTGFEDALGRPCDPVLHPRQCRHVVQGEDIYLSPKSKKLRDIELNTYMKFKEIMAKPGAMEPLHKNVVEEWWQDQDKAQVLDFTGAFPGSEFDMYDYIQDYIREFEAAPKKSLLAEVDVSDEHFFTADHDGWNPTDYPFLDLRDVKQLYKGEKKMIKKGFKTFRKTNMKKFEHLHIPATTSSIIYPNKD